MEFSKERFDRFTDRARKVLSRSLEEAQQEQSEMIGTEHILLALINDGEGVAAKVLERLGTTNEALRNTLQSLQDTSQPPSASTQPEFSPEAKQLLQFAVDEARLWGHYYLGTEHLLLAIMRIPGSVAAKALEAQNIQLEKVRTTTIQVLCQSGGEFSSSKFHFKSSIQQDIPGRDNRFNKFTERARKALSLAQEEAQRFQHNYIGTEHLLLGLVREGDGTAAKALSKLNVSLEKVRSAVEFIIGRGDRIVLGEIGLTPRAKKVVELAVDEARRLDHHYVGTEHLLLGLVREGEGIAAGVLESLGVRLEQLRIMVIKTLEAPEASSPKESLTPNNAVPPEESLAPNEAIYTFNTMKIVHHVTQQAYHAIQFADLERARLQHTTFGTEHILLGMLYDEKSLTALVFKDLGVERATLYPAIEMLREHEEIAYPWASDYTPLSKAMQDLAGHEAMLLKKESIGNEHILLALLRFPESNAVKILQHIGVEITIVRGKLIERIQQA